MSANPFVERAANVLAAQSLDSRQDPDPYRAMALGLDEAGLLNRPVETVWSGYPVKVRRAGLMVELDNGALFKALVVELARQLREDSEGVVGQLLDIAELADRVAACHTVDKRDEARAALDASLDALIDGDDNAPALGGAEQHLTSQNAWDLGHQLIELAGPRLPHQRNGSVAA